MAVIYLKLTDDASDVENGVRLDVSHEGIEEKDADGNDLPPTGAMVAAVAMIEFFKAGPQKDTQDNEAPAPAA